MSFFFARDFGTVIVWPSLSISEVRCPDPDCAAVHGWLIQLGFLFWAAGISIWRTPPGKGPAAP